MTTVGKRVSNMKGEAHICQTCIEQHSLSFPNAKDINTSMYAFGSAEAVCTVCGLNIMDSLAPKVLEKRRNGRKLGNDLLGAKIRRENPFTSLAVLIDESWDLALPMIESEDVIEQEVSEGAKFVSPDPNSKQRLMIDLNPNDSSAKQVATEISEFLEWCGFDTEIESDSDFMCVTAEL